MEEKNKLNGGLRSSFTPLGIWAFSIGTSIGWGSFIVTCNTYLSKSGILGTVFGLLIGMAVIFVITWNLQYMIRKSPDAGGVYTFERHTGGKDLGFLAFWFVLITYLAILWANMTSLPLFARFFLGNTFQFGFHYSIFGYEVWLGEALLAIAAIVIIALLCANSAKLPNHIMKIAALVFVLGFTACAAVAAFKHDSALSYAPMFTENSGAFSQIVRIAAISPWAFIGFENISHFSEEYSFPVKRIRKILIASIVVTTVLYLFVSMLSISAYPPEYENWLAYIRDMGNLEGIKAVPAFYAANYYLGNKGVIILLCALFAVILTSLIGNLLALSRLLFAAAREGEAPKKLAALNKRGVPANAIYAVVIVSIFIPFLGRTAIGWIVDVTTLGATIIYSLISYAVFKHAKESKQRAEKVTGIAGLVLMLIFLLLLLIPGLLPFDTMEIESYILFIVWSVLGLVYFRILIRRDKNREYGNRVLVWVILLVLILFTSMMWVERATEDAAENAVHQIYEYHEAHPTDGTELTEEERMQFLEQQAEKITSTNTLYTVVLLSLFALSTIIMLNNYRDTRVLDERLSNATELATKDVLTGVNNKYAFVDAENALNERIENNHSPVFAIVICDINNLKEVNDLRGHKAGDRYICKACSIICNIFQKSEIYRVGGDEFAVICQGEDYRQIDKLMKKMNDANISNKNKDDIQIAYGMARFDGDRNVDAVFERADRQMYAHKAELKIDKSKVFAFSGKTLYQFPEDLREAYESSPLSFVYYQNIDGRATPILASDGFCRNTGSKREDVLLWLRSGLFERMHPDDVGMLSQISDDFLNQRGPYDTVFRCRISSRNSHPQAKEEYILIHAVGKWQTMPDGTELAIINYANLTHTKESVQESAGFYKLSQRDRFYTDQLTGLPNLNYLHEFGEDTVNIIRTEGKIPHLVYIDIYSMQSYNNQYGIEKGDKLLRLTAGTLKKLFPNALVVRSVDDHFVIITWLDDHKELENRLSKANQIIRKTASGNTMGIRSGVCMIDMRTTIGEALDRAKHALKDIHNNINREVSFYSPEANARFMQNRYILENFDQAIKNGWIKVYYHALHRVESGKIAAFEGLSRWVDPNRGVISPGEFIPVLRKYHQLYKLDIYMFEQVCHEVQQWHESGLPIMPVSVNFSRQDFDHADIISEMNRIYEQYNLSEFLQKDNFIVEITEQDLAEGSEVLREQLAKIRENGYRLWLDDFGSGYSAVNVFSQFNFDLVKYDMELMRHLDDNNGVNRVILKEFVHLAHEIGIHTLIEGLETPEHLEFVKSIGCELAQGYYFHEPEDFDEMFARIRKGDFVKLCETPEERKEFSAKWFNT
ncbi:MAG: amino acid permease [Clostridia bacterium]|nr:amino acid permease [Clostridia bacterium]